MNNIAVIVTFNKLTLLKECLEAVLNQSIPVSKILVIDNHSTDGTVEYLKNQNHPSIVSVFSEVNLGGAGGFNLAIRKSMEFSPDNIWIMDDDTIVNVDAHEKFIEASYKVNGEYGFLASNVQFTDGSTCLMNIPKVAKKWPKLSENGLIEVLSSSFVSMFVKADLVQQIGLPIKEFFIWGDDVEFSERLSSLKPCYFVSDSIVIHKMAENKEVDILSDNTERIPRYFYNYRNMQYRSRNKGIKELILYWQKVSFLLLKILFEKNQQNRWLKLKVVIKGCIFGIFFRPKIEKI